MKRLAALALVAALATGCASPLPTVTTAPTATVPAKPTAAATATPGLDYLALRTSLLTPLGGLIVATRDNSPTRAAQRAAFDAAGDTVLAAITGDVSVNGNRLHSVVINTREAASRGDLATLERQRTELLLVR